MITIINDLSILKNRDLRYVKTPYKRIDTVIAYEKNKYLSDNIKDIIRGVDSCNTEGGNLISKFTNTPIQLGKLSDGCKTVIYVYFRARLVPNSNELIDITSCGPNAIEYILKNYSDTDLKLYLNHWEFPKDVKAKFIFNKEIIENTNELFIE